jgi:hypothetical protein
VSRRIVYYKPTAKACDDRIKLLSAMNRGDDEDRGLQPTSLVGPTTLPMAAGDTEWQL